jgi:serine/threonine protein kinase
MPEAQKFEHFQVLNHSDGSPWELGRGAMGVTYKAFDTNFRCDVALKVINPQFLSSDTARQRFVREARAAAQLRHPNVATVFHLGNSGSRFFYVMEYVDGETVERRLRREGPFRPELALRVTRQVARALVAAERQKLIHRDIKPSNIMLVNDADDENILVKVIDFGLAKSIGGSSDKSVTVTMGGFVGTPHFASPEQLEEHETDSRSDIYSLGATLWSMLLGRPPFEGSMASVIHQHLGSELPADVLRSFKPKLAALLQRMLAKKPEDRYQAPAELKQALDEVLTQPEGLSGVTTPAESAPTLAGGSLPGYANGQIVQERYEILGRSAPTIFKAKDLQTNRIVALKLLAGSTPLDPRQTEDLRTEAGKLCNVRHPNLTAVYGLESTDQGLFLIGEWTSGLTLLELLRSRRELRWTETSRLVQPLAKLFDFFADRDLLHGSVTVGDVTIEPAEPSENLDTLLKAPVDSWPPFVVKVDTLATAGVQATRAPAPTETRVAPPIVHSALKNPVQPLAQLIYELLGGVSHYGESAANALVRFAPVPALSEAGNAVLRPGIVEPTRFPSAVEFLTQLERAELTTSASAQFPPGTGFASAEQAPTEVPVGPVLHEPAGDEPHAVASPRLLRFITISVVLFGLAALATVIGVSFLTHRQTPAATQAVKEGFVTLDTMPSGASVRWNGQTIGTTPLASYHLPVGQQTLELQFPGYTSKLVQLAITNEIINNLGVVSLSRETGEFVIKTNPPGIPFEITGADQKTTSGITPLTVGNMPTGKYQVKLKRPGWPEITEEVDLAQGASVNIQHTYQGANVSLKSDPTGATIYFAGTVLGQTPLTVSLPLGQVELTSKIGSLTPITQRFVPDPSGNMMVEFKHTYGLLSVSCDRPDADVTIGGIDVGKPPIEGILPPSKQSVVVKVEGRPDQVRSVDIQAGKRVVLQFTFGGQPSAESSASPSGNSEQQVRRASPVETPVNPNQPPAKPTNSVFAGRQMTTIEATPAPSATTKPTPTTWPRSMPSPVYRTNEDRQHARDEAYKKFDAQWDAKKNAMKQEKKYIDYWIDHSSGEVKEQWKYKKKVLQDRLDRLDSERDAAKQQLKRQWNEQ